MLLAILISNYVLIILFLKSFYFLYFTTIFIIAYFLYKFKYKKNIYFMLIYILIILLTPFLFEIFDEFIYDIYLYLNIDFIYISINNLVTYILSVIHAIVFYFITFKKV